MDDSSISAEERLRLAVAAARLGYWQWDPATDKLDFSERTNEVFGLHEGHGLTFTEFLDILHPDDRERVRLAVAKSVEEKTDYSIEYQILWPSGELRWVAAMGCAYYDDAGVPRCMAGVVLDVTDRKRATEELARSEERYRSFVQQSSEAIWRCELDQPVPVNLDEDAQIDAMYIHAYLAECNDSMARMYGFNSADEIVGARLDDLMVRSDPDNVEYLKNFIRSGYRLVDAASHEVDRYGNSVYFLNNLIGIIESGHLVRAWGTQRDVSEQRRIEEDRERILALERAARGQSEHANRMKDEFLSTLSHELRTPLNAILGWSQLIQSEPMPKEIQQGVESIERNARTQVQIIDDLLDMSRITAGKVRLDVQQVRPSDVIEAALETLHPAAEAKGVRIHKVLDPLAGPVSGDPGRLQQVMWNIFSNAVKFTPRGGRVQVLLERVNSHIEITVSDTGQGIEPEFLPFIFDRFSQADSSTRRRYGGLGLGLAIAKSLLELHGGSIRAKSPGLDQGATFIIALPLMVVHERDDGREHPANAQSGQPELSAPMLAGVKALVVDDEPDARELICRVLQKRGAEVAVAASAQEALQMLARYRPDILISDIGMPVEDGYDLIRAVRSLDAEQGGTIPAIALTAFARTEDRQRAFLAGFQLHVSKPVEPNELVAMVASLVGRIPKG